MFRGLHLFFYALLFGHFFNFSYLCGMDKILGIIFLIVTLTTLGWTISEYIYEKIKEL